ncbi:MULTISPECIES: glycosyltransferase family 4 protein [unclassified Oceanobacter]|jgi:glycosyltransferase involved in cell wall biosynthesis|uniref:glycosyltransferase family 4 protein n=1 Tax=unclassified Oceanobacter TaxID=2620260 RepID=UPI0026E1D81E|nr:MULTISPECIES: glycosyltransferase family 4 protein [unclassified Oceanobacter]MDO6681385.1 glycosyltransferase family 4 protein [Oceanobacter sp. 5_MG-2023]MDP2548218.1 glycosyltransferase family 4 protein [Oceanobacter sp. 4_MG-2023]
MKTALIIGYVWPEPASSAAGSRMLQLVAALQSGGYQIVFGSPADWSQHAVALADYNVEAIRLELNSTTFDHYIAGLQPDLVMFDRFMMEEQFGWRVEENCPNALRVLDMEDVHSLRHARHQALKEGVEPGLKHVYSELAIREVAAILRCDQTLVISEYEYRWLQQQFQIPAAQLIYLPFMLSPEQWQQPITRRSQRQHFVCIGNFRHEPNWDAVRWLREAIWPGIRQQLPQAEMHVYGAYPPKKATSLQNEKLGFYVPGWANDALEVVRSAGVMLAPLRFGAGLKGKLLDAAITGTPAVTTPVGAEGMYECEGGCGLTPGTQGVLVAESATAFVTSAVRLYQNDSLWDACATAALQLAPERFAFAEHAPRWLACLQTLEANLEAHRLSGFYGAMLRHHTLKSTRYMSQWIEAKNRLL